MTRTTLAGHAHSRPLSRAALTACVLCAAFIMLCGASEAANYYNDIDVASGNASDWSTNLSSNVSVVSGNITVYGGAMLNLSKAIIVMNCSSPRNITVKDGAAMNVSNSTINQTGASYYDWRYEKGSTGSLIDSVIEGNASKKEGTGVGIYTNYLTISNSTFKNKEYGIKMQSSYYTSIANCTVTNNTYGIWMDSSHHNNLTNNSVDGSDNAGIYLKSSDYNTLSDNTANSSSYGIYLLSSWNNDLKNNTANSNTKSGIYLQNSTNNDLNNNAANSNPKGISLDSSDDNTLGGNRMNTSTEYGLYVTGKYNNRIDPYNNTVGGEPVYYYYDYAGGALNNTIITKTKVCNLGRITLINSSDFTLQNITIINNSGGIYIWGSSGSRVTDSMLRNTSFGIYITGSSDSSAANNNISGNIYQGINIYQSDGAVITNNTLTVNAEGVRVSGGSDISINSNTMQSNTEGIYISGSNNTSAAGNTISSGEHGIYLADVINNTIFNNTAANSNYGIYVIDSSSNNITYNNASNNSNYGIYITNSFSNNITNNNASNNSNGIYLYESNDNNLSANILQNNIEGITLKYYSKNNTIKDNNISKNKNNISIEITDYSDYNTLYASQKSDKSDIIKVDRCSNTRIVPNASYVNESIYLVDDVEVVLLDAVFNESSINITANALLTVEWRVDVQVKVGYQNIRGANVSIYYKNGERAWSNVTTTERDGSLDNTALPEIIQYTLNKTNIRNETPYYQPINVTANETLFGDGFTPDTYINRTDITVIVMLQKYSANGYCYYCHRDKMKFEQSDHAVNNKTCGPINCTDCHNRTDSEAVPHTFTSGPDLLISRSPQLCYDGNGDRKACHRPTGDYQLNLSGFPVGGLGGRLDQKTEFTNYTSHHPVDGVNMSCDSCHDNHGASAEYAGPKNGSEQDPPWWTGMYGNIWTINESYRRADHDLKRYFYTGNDTLGKLTKLTKGPHTGNYTASGAFGGYHPEAFELCYTCHLEEDKMNTTNQKTNFWEPNYTTSHSGLEKFAANLHAFHLVNKSDITSGCRNCHNPHGSPHPRMTRDDALYGNGTGNSTGGFFAFFNNSTYPAYRLTNSSDWDNATLNKGAYITKNIYDGGWGSPNERPEKNCNCHEFDPPQPGEPFDPNNVILRNHSYIRNFTTVTPTGGPNCSYCHSSEYHIPYKINATVNYTAVKMGMHANLNKECNITLWAERRGFNVSNVSSDNKICWGCHATDGNPPYPNFHPDRSLNPYKCAKCHGSYQPPHVNASVNYNASIVRSHGPTTGGNASTGVQTDIGRGGSCHDCHSPSRIIDINLTRYDHTTVLGNVSHYGVNRTEGENGKFNVAGHLFNTMECLWCHNDSANASAWGNATQMYNTTPHIHNVSWNNTVCLECHVEGNSRGSIKYNITSFHSTNKTDRPMWTGGPDCVVCHKLNNQFNYTAVNTTAILHDIHANINERIDQSPYISVDPASKLCWVCHDSTGDEVYSMGDRYTSPWKCRDCHTPSGERRYTTQHNTIMPYLVEEHQPDAKYVRTNKKGKPNGTCAFCHNNSIDTNHKDTSAGNIGNTLEAVVSHYGLNRTYGGMLMTASNRSTDCIYCHNSSVNGSRWGNATQIRLGIHGNASANKSSDCWDCHADNATILSQKGFHNGTMRFGGGPNCTQCHDIGGIATNVNITSINSSMHGSIRNSTVFEYYESQPCWVCHGDGSEPLNKTHPVRAKNPYQCDYCHASEAGNMYAKNYSKLPPPLVYEHIPNGTYIHTNVRGAPNGTCQYCHNNSIDIYNNDTYPGRELTNYLLANVSHYGLNRTHNMLMAQNANSTDCLYCHGSRDNGTKWGSAIQATHGAASNAECWGCHNRTGGGGMPLTFHAINQSYGDTSDCLRCHDINNPESREGYKWVNGTAVRESVHSAVNNGTSDINRTCWACHFTNGTVTNITDHTARRGYPGNPPPYNCWECHNTSAKPYADVSDAANVTEHLFNSTNVRAIRNAANETESCLACHNLNETKVSGYNITNATYSNLSYVSHYARNYTELSSRRNLTNSTEYCSYCHNNASGVFAGFIDQPFINKSCQNITHGSNCSACHGAGRIHDASINKSLGADCLGCHGDMNSSIAPGYYVNMNMFNESVHRIRPGFNCTDCHTMTGYSNRSYNHPSLEFGWKWCECCHSYQADPLNMTQRHNATSNPLLYLLNVNGNLTSVVNITECTFCHNATAYSNAVANYNNSTAANYTTNNCRYCHEYPDKGNVTGQSWY
jgi:parallel beta-helix repeat protein